MREGREAEQENGKGGKGGENGELRARESRFHPERGREACSLSLHSHHMAHVASYLYVGQAYRSSVQVKRTEEMRGYICSMI